MAVKLDTLVIYSQGAADKYNGDVETRIDHLIETTNKIYKDSGLDVTMNSVKVQHSTDDIDRAYIDHNKTDVLVPKE